MAICFHGSTGKDMAKLFMETCGVPREVGLRMRSYPDHYHTPNHMSELDKHARDILNSNQTHLEILTKMALSASEKSNDEFDWTQSLVITDVLGPLLSRQKNELIDMQDKGFIYFSVQDTDKFGIFSPLLYLHTINLKASVDNKVDGDINHCLSTQEITSLYNPADSLYEGQCKLALLKLLSRCTSLWKALGFDEIPRQLLVFKTRNETDQAKCLKLLFKESPFICYVPSDDDEEFGTAEHSDVAWYFSVGYGNLEDNQAQAIVHSFSELGKKCSRCLLTTLHLTTSARLRLTGNNIRIFDATDLHHYKFWPVVLKCLGKQFQAPR